MPKTRINYLNKLVNLEDRKTGEKLSAICVRQGDNILWFFSDSILKGKQACWCDTPDATPLQENVFTGEVKCESHFKILDPKYND